MFRELHDDALASRWTETRDDFDEDLRAMLAPALKLTAEKMTTDGLAGARQSTAESRLIDAAEYFITERDRRAREWRQTTPGDAGSFSFLAKHSRAGRPPKRRGATAAPLRLEALSKVGQHQSSRIPCRSRLSLCSIPSRGGVLSDKPTSLPPLSNVPRVVSTRPAAFRPRGLVCRWPGAASGRLRCRQE